MSNVDSLGELSNQSDKIFDLNNIDSLVYSLNHFAQNNIKLSSPEIDLAKKYTWQESAKKHAEVYLGLLK
jgi:hypothetical protein